MSQSHDHPPQSSYWQVEGGQEPDALAALEASDRGDAQGQPGVAAPPPGLVGAWQTPATSALAPVSQGRPLALPGRKRRPSLLTIFAVLLLVVLFGAVGSVSGFAVSRAVHQRGQPGVSTPARVGQVPAGTSTPHPVASASPIAHPTASPTAQPTARREPVVLAQDDFQRPDQSLWGMASDGSTWGGDANKSAAFAIVGGVGQVTGGRGFFNAILGPLTANEEVVMSGSVDHFDNLRDNLGAVLRWTDDNNYYKAYFDGASLILIKRVAGAVTRLGAVPFSARDGVRYSLRFRLVGSQLLVRAWPSEAAEPGTWMISASDRSLASGYGGLRVLVEPGITITVALFQERSTV
jgi:hypothetical protein